MIRTMSQWAPAGCGSRARLAMVLVLAWTVSACGATRTASAPTPAPDTGKRIAVEHAAVTSANPLASEAGVAMLRAGGNAIDAAVATAFAIGVVEPQMSGLGGGGSMLIWLQDERRAEYLDFYAAQDATSFAGVDGEVEEPDLRVVGVPGDVAGLLLAHERFGRLPRATVIAPAIHLAESGFPVNQILAQMITQDSAKLHRFDAARTLFWPDGRPLQPGSLLRNPRLAESLRAISESGSDAFFPTPNNRRVQLENGFGADVLGEVRAMGWDPAALSFGYARLYSIVRVGDRWIAVADPRHDGEPRGW